MTQHSAQKGYSLVEVLVAVSILLIALIGPMTIATKGLQSAFYAREQATAIFLAQEGIELFVAIRNDAMIAAINSGNLDTSWDWTTDSRLDECRDSTGCNVVLTGTDGGDTALDQVTIRDCANPTQCRLSYVPSAARARYGFTGTETPYTRTITLTPTNDGGGESNGIIITSEVRWDSTLFGAGNTGVTLSGAVYKIYDNP